MTELVLLALFLVAFAAGATLMWLAFGPDEDLRRPWTPGDRPWWKP